MKYSMENGSRFLEALYPIHEDYCRADLQDLKDRRNGKHAGNLSGRIKFITFQESFNNFRGFLKRILGVQLTCVNPFFQSLELSLMIHPISRFTSH
jgi:hypothetical protein